LHKGRRSKRKEAEKEKGKRRKELVGGVKQEDFVYLLKTNSIKNRHKRKEEKERGEGEKREK
jgi:hypothetical protein